MQDIPSLSDDQLTAIADELFLEMDKEESKDVESQTQWRL
jgi:hypothetical protein